MRESASREVRTGGRHHPGRAAATIDETNRSNAASYLSKGLLRIPTERRNDSRPLRPWYTPVNYFPVSLRYHCKIRGGESALIQVVVQRGAVSPDDAHVEGVLGFVRLQPRARLLEQVGLVLVHEVDHLHVLLSLRW